MCTFEHECTTGACLFQTEDTFLFVQTKPNDFQVSLDVFPENVFQDASEWFDVACWGQVKPLAHEVIAKKAIVLLKEQKYDDAFELTLSGTSGDAKDAEHYFQAFAILMPSYSKLKPSNFIHTWELTAAFVRFCRCAVLAHLCCMIVVSRSGSQYCRPPQVSSCCSCCMAVHASGIKQILAVFLCRNTNKQFVRSAGGVIKNMAEQMTASRVHRIFLYTCADFLCNKVGHATNADYFSNSLSLV